MSESAMGAGEAKRRLKRIMDNKMDEFFEERSKKPWKTDEWREDREENIGDECEWCGESDADLVMHHTDPKHQRNVGWRSTWMDIEDEMFEASERYKALPGEVEEVCPACGSKSIYERKTMDVAYRCIRCEKEFNEPEKERSDSAPKEEYYRVKLGWVEENVDEIRERFKREYESHWDDYFDLSSDDVVTICNSCHYAWHENNMKPCVMCEDGYGKYRGDIIFEYENDEGEKWEEHGDYLCWEHYADAKGLEECDCGDGWYNPEYNDECKSCRN